MHLVLFVFLQYVTKAGRKGKLVSYFNSSQMGYPGTYYDKRRRTGRPSTKCLKAN